MASTTYDPALAKTASREEGSRPGTSIAESTSSSILSATAAKAKDMKARLKNKVKIRKKDANGNDAGDGNDDDDDDDEDGGDLDDDSDNDDNVIDLGARMTEAQKYAASSKKSTTAVSKGGAIAVDYAAPPAAKPDSPTRHLDSDSRRVYCRSLRAGAGLSLCGWSCIT